MSTRPLVSVIVIFKDAEDFLAEAIESVRAQTFDGWELLLVDDGSRDASTEIARAHVAAGGGRVRYLQHPGHANRGPSAARNLGIGHARGDFVALLDADDVWVPEKLEQQVRILGRHPDVGMVYGPAEWWYSWTGAPEDRGRDYVEPVRVSTATVIEPPSLVEPWFVAQRAAIPNPSSVLVRRALAEQVGGFEESFRDVYEDQVFNAKVCVNARIIASEACWARYRQHRTSATALAAARAEENAARSRFLAWLIEYLARHGVNGAIQAALRRQRFRYAHPRLSRIAGRVGVSF
jgi:glycosyltransferase involved in cell wall biosynthesis